jgi:glyoxylase-like metal-dependent hydrolase (beta-lactamase superfamily II)
MMTTGRAALMILIFPQPLTILRLTLSNLSRFIIRNLIMQRERVTNDIYVFISDLYAQVTAGLVVTATGAVLIDTMAYPEETRQIKQFVEHRLGLKVLFVINTHYHADHTTGTCFFDEAQIVAHAKCRDLLNRRGRESLERAKANAPEMRDLELALPTVVFDGGELTLYVGGKTLELRATPGHSPDGIICLVKEDQVLFGGDTLMPIPYFVDGDYNDFLTSLESLRGGTFEHIVQGHGEVILRGEIDEKIESDIVYLRKLREAVDRALSAKVPEQALNSIDVERCGKSRVLLNGMVEQLHRRNVATLAEVRREQTLG